MGPIGSLKVGLLLLHALTSIVGPTTQLEYPGSSAYLELDRYLERHSKNDSVEFNLSLIKQLVHGLQALGGSADHVRPTRILAPAGLVLAQTVAASEARCDLETNQLVKFNLMGTLPDKTKCRLYDHPKHLRSSKLASIIYSSTLDIVAIGCEQNIESQASAIVASSFSSTTSWSNRRLARSYQLLESYLSEEFIDEYTRLTLGDPQLSEASFRLEAIDEQDFGRLPHPMILNQLLLGVANISQEVPRTRVGLANLELSWPQLDQAQLCDLIDRHILLPCGDYLDKLRPNVFEMFHWIKNHFSAQSLDLNKFLARRGRPFRYLVFRYDFCDTFTGAFSKLWLWQAYKELVFPTRRIGRRI